MPRQNRVRCLCRLIPQGAHDTIDGAMEMIVLIARALALACRGHQELVLENLALRQQLHALRRTGARPRLGWRDRAVSGSRWRALWRWRRQHSCWTSPGASRLASRTNVLERHHGSRGGRPRTDATIRTLVSQMAAANPLWGAPRIHGELRKVGVDVSERTVSRLLRRPRRPPSQTWRTFLTNHVATLVSIDFFAVPTLTGRPVRLRRAAASPPADRSRERHGPSHGGLDGATTR